MTREVKKSALSFVCDFALKYFTIIGQEIKTLLVCVLRPLQFCMAIMTHVQLWTFTRLHATPKCELFFFAKYKISIKIENLDFLNHWNKRCINKNNDFLQIFFNWVEIKVNLMWMWIKTENNVNNKWNIWLGCAKNKLCCKFWFRFCASYMICRHRH